MKLISSIGGGLAGAVALTVLHQILKNVSPDAPRMDLMGKQAVRKGLDKVSAPMPDDKSLYNIAMVGDIISNTIYYSLGVAGNKKYIMPKGALMGLAAGLGAVFLPKSFGLNPAYSSRTLTTKAFTTGLYLLGGLVASTVAKKLEGKNGKKKVFIERPLDLITNNKKAFLNG